jgi:hypothetical protein
MAFYEGCEDPVVLHAALERIAPLARRAVADFLRAHAEDALPAPADLRPARAPASASEAAATLAALRDLPLIQALGRSIGRRVEAIEIAASAEFPVGARVIVPERASFPPPGRRLAGAVELTGTSLTVRLDNGETWEGPPSLAVLEGHAP